MLLDLTIAIPVRNEEINLPGCLNAIGKDLTRHIVVIDSGSSDSTVEIARKFGAEVVNFEWNGKFPKKRNWFLRNYHLKTKWILFLDADEFLTEEFKVELREKIKGSKEVGFWLAYTIYFMGKKLKGGYPLNKLALFQVGAGEYERIDENRWSTLDMEIHEHPNLAGRVGKFSSKIDHQDYRDVSHYFQKQSEYASWEARRFLLAKDTKGITRNWTWKQKLKYRLMESPFIGPVFFFGSFFILGGWKDGSRGFVFAILKMAYFTQIYCKINEELMKKDKNII